MTDENKTKKQLIEELEQLRLLIEQLKSETNEKNDSEERYKQVVLSSQDAMIFFDIDARWIINVNNAAERMYGYSREEFLKLKYNDITAEPDASDRALKELESKQSLLTPLRYHRRKDGTKFPVEISGSFIPFYNGQKVACGIIRNITERKQAEDALNKEKAFTESALNSIPDMFFVFDLEGRFLRWNKALNTVTGYSNGEISAMKPADFFLKEETPRVIEAIGRVVREGYAWLEAVVLTKGGKKIHYEFTGSLLKENEGKIIGISGTGRDITERKEAEVAIDKANLLNKQIIDGAQEDK